MTKQYESRKWLSYYSDDIERKVINLHYSDKYKYPKFTCKDFNREIDIIKHKEGMDNLTHIQDYLEILYTESGCAYLSFEEKEIRIPANSFVLIGTTQPHTDRSTPGSDIYQFLISYNTIIDNLLHMVNEAPRLAAFFTNFILNPNGLNYILYTDIDFLDSSIANGLENILRAFAEKKEHYIPIIKSELALLLLRVSREYGAKAIASKNKSISDNIIEYMHMNYNTVSLQTLADYFSYNKDHVSRIIKKATGKTFHQLLTQIRMEQAAILLRETELPISHVSSIIGYNSIIGFLEAFKKYYAQTPAIFRQSNKAALSWTMI